MTRHQFVDRLAAAAGAGGCRRWTRPAARRPRRSASGRARSAGRAGRGRRRRRSLRGRALLSSPRPRRWPSRGCGRRRGSGSALPHAADTPRRRTRPAAAEARLRLGHGVQQAGAAAARRPLASAPALRAHPLALLDEGAVQQHHRQQVDGGAGGEDRAAKAQRAQPRQQAAVVDVRMGEQHEVDLPAIERPGLRGCARAPRVRPGTCRSRPGSARRPSRPESTSRSLPAPRR